MGTQALQYAHIDGGHGREWFKDKVIDLQVVRRGNDEFIQLENPENRALTLARREKFDVICREILWEGEDRNQFGELLRGIVLHYLPENHYQLTLLRNIVAIQWQLHRIGAIQHSVYHDGAARPGKYGLPAGTLQAMTFSKDTAELMEMLERAIRAYRMAGRK